MAQERERVLQMVKDGQITVDDGLKLLEAMEASSQVPVTVAPGEKRCLRVRVLDGDRSKVNVTIPIGVIRWGLKFGMSFASMGMAFIPKEAREQMTPETFQMIEKVLSDGRMTEELDEMLAMMGGKFVDITDSSNGRETKVEVSIE